MKFDTAPGRISLGRNFLGEADGPQDPAIREDA
jgi:hypothetical protein